MNDIFGKTPSYSCQSNDDQHCQTCADEAVAVRVVRLDQEVGLALVEASDLAAIPNAEEIDVTLVENVVVGDVLLAHGGVAIARLEQGQTHEH